jgi:hypothetical protein
LPKEQFLYSETKPVFDLIEETSRRSGVSRAQAFEDYLHMSVCALSGGQMEEQYMATVKKHSEGKPGKRGCDSIAQAFGALVDAMEKTRYDILGDLFQGSITYGEAGQFLTPEPVCQMMAAMTVSDLTDEESSSRKTVCDPCVGSGRMLLAVADLKPHWEFVGQDVDLRCVRMTAINLALRNLCGYVVWGNSLGLEKKLVYRTGFNLRGVIREIPIDKCTAPVQQVANAPVESLHEVTTDESNTSPKSDDDEPLPRGKQLRLF